MAHRRGGAAAALGAVVLLGSCSGEVAAPGAEPVPASDNGAWVTVWEDDFDGPALDPRWTVEHSTFGHAGGSVHCYTPANVAIGDGFLRLSGQPETVDCPDGNGVREFTSGMVRARGATGGIDTEGTAWRVDVRMRAPSGQGLWPAAWLGPDSDAYGPWPQSGEIDIVEVLGRDPGTAVGTLHWAEGAVHEQLAGTVAQAAEEFHTYTVEWSGTGFEWSLDGVPYHQVTTWAVPPGAAFPAPFDRSFELRLNLAIGGRWPGMPDATTPWPATLEIDWVRVQQR